MGKQGVLSEDLGFLSEEWMERSGKRGMGMRSKDGEGESGTRHWFGGEEEDSRGSCKIESGRERRKVSSVRDQKIHQKYLLKIFFLQ